MVVLLVVLHFCFCTFNKQPMAKFYFTLYTIFVKLKKLEAGIFINLLKAFFGQLWTSAAQCFKLKFLTVFLRTTTVVS